MTKELPWFFHAVKHGLDIEELKKWVLDKQIITPEKYGEYSGRGNSNQHFFDKESIDGNILEKSSVRDFLYDMTKGICERNDIPFENMQYSNSWTVDGYKDSKHLMHNHSDVNGLVVDGMSVLLYLNLPEDMSDMQGWFCYIDKDGEWCYVKPELDTVFIFSQQILHGTIEQNEGLRKTLNVEFTKNKEK